MKYDKIISHKHHTLSFMHSNCTASARLPDMRLRRMRMHDVLYCPPLLRCYIAAVVLALTCAASTLAPARPTPMEE